MATGLPDDEDPYCDEDGNRLLRFRLNEATLEYLVLGAGGWAAWELEGGQDIRVRLEPRGERIAITAVAVLPSKAWNPNGVITATDLRSVPLVRLEGIINDPRLVEVLMRAMAAARLDGHDLSPTSEVNPREVYGECEVPPLKASYELAGVTDGKARPNEFYADVAAAWTMAISEGHRNPADVIAQANNVPASTVHRWVREARRRKLMPPSSRAANRVAIP